MRVPWRFLEDTGYRCKIGASIFNPSPIDGSEHDHGEGALKLVRS